MTRAEIFTPEGGLATPLDLEGLLAALAEGVLVVHVGPGLNRQEYPETEARAVLIEGDPQTAAVLRDHLVGRPRMRVVTGALLGQGAEPLLRRYALDMLSGFGQPGPALTRLLPGLEEESREQVPALDDAALAAALGASEADEDVLILETPGAAAGILARLEGCGQLERFARIVLRAAPAGAFDDETSAEELAAWFDERGWSFETAPGDQEADFPLLNCRRDAAATRAKRVANLSARLERNEAELEAARAELEEHTTQAARLAELEAAHAELTERFERSRAECARLERRLGQSQEEMRKAEGQIALIRDLLLRDTAS